MSLRNDIAEDYVATLRRESKPTLLRMVHLFFKSSGFRTAVLYRVGHRQYQKRHRVRSGLWRRILTLLSGIEISTEAEIGPGLNIPHTEGVIVGNGVQIGRHAYILQGVTLGGRAGRTAADGRTQPWLGDNVLVGAGAKILGPVRIGDNVTIGANAVVLHDIPSNSTAVGIPARVVRKDGQRVGLLEQDGELSELLRELQQRVGSLEKDSGSRSQE